VDLLHEVVEFVRGVGGGGRIVGLRDGAGLSCARPERYDRGLTDFLNVLDAERQQFDLEESEVEARRAEALVGLFRALGGGWPLKEKLPDIPKPRPAVEAAMKYLRNPGRTP
jgi:hypothetical protein